MVIQVFPHSHYLFDTTIIISLMTHHCFFPLSYFEQECHSNFSSFCFSLIGTHVQCKNLGFDTQFGFLWFFYVVVDSWVELEQPVLMGAFSSFFFQKPCLAYPLLRFFFNYAFKMNTLLESCHFLHGTFHYILDC